MVTIMNRLPMEKRVAVVKALVEGNSIRSTVRLTGVAKNTIVKLLGELGLACAEYQDKALRNLTCKRIQCDEIWAFCYAKKKNVTPEIREKNPDAGDVWTWTAIDSDTKLIVSYLVGAREYSNAMEFMRDVSGRLANRVQLTTDGFRFYLQAVEYGFGTEGIDYAQLIKYYGEDPENEKRYSPAVCTSCEKRPMLGDPDPKHISTSHVERQNLSMRMSMRRFTRLTNGFSKKLENHMAAVSLYFMYYNFGRVHQTLRVTPAMQAGVANHVWTAEEIVGLLD